MKFNCKDELVELLNNYGYNLVLLPRENIEPLQLLSRNSKGGWTRMKDVFSTPRLDDTHAKLSELFIADSQAMPVPIDGDVSNDVKGKRSSSMSVEAAVELMVNFLDLPTEDKSEAQKLKIQAALQTAKQVSFAFGEEASASSVSLLGLDAFISDAQLRDKVGNAFRDLASRGQLYIITSVLKATSFTMKGSNEKEASVLLDIPKIQAVLEGKAKGNIAVFEQSGLKYKGTKAMVFGFKAVRLIPEKKNEKWVYKIKTQDGMALKNEENLSVDILQEQNVNLLDME